MTRVSIHAKRSWQPQQVRDCRYPCPRRFPEFSSACPSSCALFASPGCAPECRRLQQTRCQRAEVSTESASYGIDNQSLRFKLYALRMKIPCRICRTSTLDCDHFGGILTSARQADGEARTRILWQAARRSFAAVKFGDEPHYVKSQPEMRATVGVRRRARSACSGLPQGLE